ncbi:MAG: hypothetical protein U5L96_19845 [Owenweeksia sp.]|nr:hypothetical protein [Owenweeksia sp.]
MKRLFLTCTICCLIFSARAQSDTNLKAGDRHKTSDPGIERLQRAYIAQNESGNSLVGYRVIPGTNGDGNLKP